MSQIVHLFFERLSPHAAEPSPPEPQDPKPTWRTEGPESPAALDLN